MANSKLYFLFLLLALSICIHSCSKNDDTPDAFTYADVEDNFKTIEIKPGTQDIILEVGENLFYNFRVIFPDVDLTQKWPMVLTLHGFSGGDANAHTFTDCYVEPGLADLDVIIISPNGNIGDDNWETLNNQDQLRILTDLTVTPSLVAWIAVCRPRSIAACSFSQSVRKTRAFSAPTVRLARYSRSFR